MKNGDKVYKRVAPIDHEAIEIELAVDVIFPRRLGSIVVIDYNNKEGWIKYKKLSDKYHPR